MHAHPFRLFTLGAATVVVLAACTPGGQPTASNGGSSAKNSNKVAQASWNPQPRDKVKDGGTLTTAIAEIAPQMNVHQANMTAHTRTIWNWYNPVLTYHSPEGEFLFDQNYLTEMPREEVKDGRTIVTYKLHDKAVYNDGTPLDWRAYEAVWKTCGEITPDDYSCNTTDGYKLIEKVEKGGSDKEVKVTFKQAYPWWKGLFNTLLHPSATAKDTFNKGYTEGRAHPEWGAGPFKLDNFDPKGDTVTFVPNEKWWGDKPKLEKRVFKLMEANAGINAFKNGQIDSTDVANRDFLQQVQPLVKDGTAEVRTGNRGFSNIIEINAKAPMMGDISVREAIFRGIDRKTIMNVVFQGIDYAEEAPGSLLLFPFQKGYQDNMSDITFDKARANQILDDAGWKKNGEFREKDGAQLKVRLPIFGDATLVKSRASALQSMMRDIGVNLEIQSKPAADLSKVTKARDFDILMVGFNSVDPYGVGGLCEMYCSNTTLNKSSTGSAQLDEKIHAVEKLTSGDEQISKANELEREAFKQYGIMPLYNGPTMVAVKKGLANYGASAFGSAPVQDIGWQK